MKFHQKFVSPIFGNPLSYVEFDGDHLRYVDGGTQSWRLPIKDITPDLAVAGVWGTLSGYGTLRFNHGGRTYEVSGLQDARGLRRAIDQYQAEPKASATSNEEPDQNSLHLKVAHPRKLMQTIQRDPEFMASIEKEKKPLLPAPVFERRFFSEEDKRRYEAFAKHRKNEEHWHFRHQTILPYHFRHVWETLLRVEYLSYWFFGNSPAKDDKIEPLPSQFGPGVAFKVGLHYGEILDAELFKKLTFRFNENYFDMTLKDFGPSATQAELRVYDFVELAKNGFVRSIQRSNIRKQAAKGMWGDQVKADDNGNVATLRSRLLQLGDLCHDLMNYGEPLGWGDQPDLSWRRWHSESGMLHLLRDSRDNDPLQVGHSLREGKIGFVVPHGEKNDPIKDEAYFLQKYYIENPGGGTLLEVHKHHGDSIESGERIYLIRWDEELIRRVQAGEPIESAPVDFAAAESDTTRDLICSAYHLVSLSPDKVWNLITDLPKLHGLRLPHTYEWSDPKKRTAGSKIRVTALQGGSWDYFVVEANEGRYFSIGPSPLNWAFRFTLDSASGKTNVRFQRRFAPQSMADRIGDTDPFGSKHRKECQELTQATIDRLVIACRRLAEGQSDGITPSNLGSEQAAAASPGAADERFEIKEDRLSEKRTQAQLDALRRYEIGLPFTTEQLRDKCRYWLQNVPNDMKEQVRKDYETLLELAS